MASESGGNVGRYWAVTGGLVAAVLGVAFYRPLPPVLSARFSPADIHSEYVKYLSGPDTITAYLAYPERPDAAAVGRIQASGLGVYAENDSRIDAGLPDLSTALKRTGVDYHYTVYPGVGHAFLQQTDKPQVADSAWAAIVAFFHQKLER